MDEEEHFRILIDSENHHHFMFRDEDDEEEKLDCGSANSSNDSDAGDGNPPFFVDPEPHVSSQFYTFNKDSHTLMARCVLESRHASPDEIRTATPPAVLASWRGVWKDRNEDTAYLTAWKRIQDKLAAYHDPHTGDAYLFFKNNPAQYVSHVSQWQDIVMKFHGDADLRHLGLKDTIERIKQVWTVGAKFYGIPESFIRVCVSSCPICNSTTGTAAPRTKRRRFEYTDSFEVPARDVPARLQQLAAKHKVVLCIRQKYIRYKPFIAEVKDYACHRAGEPNTKRTGALKRERYASKRCGCGFRIRAIVPITNYHEKEKTFSYDEEGMAIFKLYAVHSGHEPGPHEGSARVIHRFVANSGFDDADNFKEDPDPDPDGRVRVVVQQMQELKIELGFLENKVAGLSNETLASISHDLCAITQRLRSLEGQPPLEQVLLGNSGILEWRDCNGSGHKVEENAGGIISGSSMMSRMGFDGLAEWPKGERIPKDSKWMDAVKDDEFDDKNILISKLCKQMRQDGGGDIDDVGMQVDGLYPDNPKWYEGMACGLDPNDDCADELGHDGFRHSGIA